MTQTTSRSLRLRVATAAGWVLAAVAGLAWTSRWTDFHWQPLIVMASLAPYLWVLAIPSAVLLTLHFRTLGPAFGILLLTALLIVELPLIRTTQAPAGVNAVLLQVNLRVGNADPSALVARVRRERIDVLTLDELTPQELTALSAKGLDALLPYRFTVPYRGGAGTGIWSRFPLSGETRFDEFRFEGLRAEVAVPSAATIQLWAVHILPPWPYPSEIWTQEMAHLRSLLDAPARQHRTVVVSGDFNATYDHREFRRLLGSQYRDAAEASGAGLTRTYPTDRPFPPLLALDHVLVSRAGVRSVSTVAVPGSDHRGLLVHITAPAAA